MNSSGRAWRFLASLYRQDPCYKFDLHAELEAIAPSSHRYKDYAKDMSPESPDIAGFPSLHGWQRVRPSEDANSIFIGSSSEEEEEENEDSRFIVKQQHVLKHYLFADQFSKPKKPNSARENDPRQNHNLLRFQTLEKEKLLSEFFESLANQVCSPQLSVES
jgi:hypothetical protein